MIKKNSLLILAVLSSISCQTSTIPNDIHNDDIQTENDDISIDDESNMILSDDEFEEEIENNDDIKNVFDSISN